MYVCVCVYIYICIYKHGNPTQEQSFAMISLPFDMSLLISTFSRGCYSVLWQRISTYMAVSINGAIPKWMLYPGKSSMDDPCYPTFHQKISIYILYLSMDTSIFAPRTQRHKE